MFVTVKNIDADSLRYLRCMVKRRCKITINFPDCSQDFEKKFNKPQQKRRHSNNECRLSEHFTFRKSPEGWPLPLIVTAPDKPACLW